MRILLVDDEDLSRRGLRAMITRSIPDAEIVGEATDGQAAVEAVESLQPDLVLMDIRMPEMDGVEAAGRIVEIAPYTRIVFLSAYDEFEYAREAVRIGADAYLLKPVDKQELVRVIEDSARRLVEKRRVATFDQRAEIEHVRRWAAAQLVYAIIQGDEERYRQIAAFLSPGSDAGTLLLVQFAVPCDTCFAYLERTLAREGVVYLLQTGEGDGILFLPAADPARTVDLVHKKGSAQSGGECRVRGASVHGAGRESNKVYRALTAGLQEGPAALVLPEGSRPEGILTGEDLSRESVVVPDLRGRVETVLAERDVFRRQQQLGELAEEICNLSPDPAITRELCVELVVIFRALVLPLIGGDAASLGRGYLEELWSADSIPHQRTLTRQQLLHCEQLLREVQVGRYNWRLTRAVDYILQHLRENLYLDSVAEYVGVSPQHLSRLFKEELDTTFTRFVNDQRIERARYLLLSTSLGVGEIAAEIGYRDADYFSKVFRRFYDCSPSDYRNAIGPISPG